MPADWLDDLAGKVAWLEDCPVIGIDGRVTQSRDWRNLRNEASRLIEIARAAREFLDAHDIGHEEEHMFVSALRDALEVPCAKP